MERIVYVWISLSVLIQVIRHAEGIWHKLEWTFHKETASWNTAENVCKANDGLVVELKSKSKSKIFEYYLRKHEEGGDGDFWIGLFDKNIPRRNFAWTDCKEVTYTHWGDREPDEPHKDHCIRATRSELEWKTKNCNENYQFVCEKKLGNCTFTRRLHTEIPESNDGSYETEVLLDKYDTLQDCQAQCQGSISSSKKECFGVTLSLELSGGKCSLYKASTPLAIMSALQTRMNHTLSYRVCYEAKKDSTSVSGSLRDDSSQPSIHCAPDLSNSRTPPEQRTTAANPVETITTTTTETQQSFSSSKADSMEKMSSSTEVPVLGLESTLNQNALITEDMSSTDSTNDAQMSTDILNLQSSTISLPKTDTMETMSPSTEVPVLGLESTLNQNSLITDDMSSTDSTNDAQMSTDISNSKSSTISLPKADTIETLSPSTEVPVLGQESTLNQDSLITEDMSSTDSTNDAHMSTDISNSKSSTISPPKAGTMETIASSTEVPVLRVESTLNQNSLITEDMSSTDSTNDAQMSNISNPKSSTISLPKADTMETMASSTEVPFLGLESTLNQNAIITDDMSSTDSTNDVQMSTDISNPKLSTISLPKTDTMETMASTTEVPVLGLKSTLNQNALITDDMTSTDSTNDALMSTDISNPKSSTTSSLADKTTPTTQTTTCIGASCQTLTASAAESLLPQSSTDSSYSTDGLCPCSCGSHSPSNEPDAQIASILETLAVKKEQISSYKRKYLSMPDDRPSAQFIGYFGGVCMGVVFGGLILMDIPKLISDVKMFLNCFTSRININ